MAREVDLKAESGWGSRRAPMLEARREERARARLMRAGWLDQSVVAASTGDVAELRRASIDALVRHAVPVQPLPARTEVEDALPVQPAPARPVEPAPVEPTPPRPARPWRGDAALQAETLRRASQQGAAFCEVCERARREREARSAAIEPDTSVDASTQAASLRRAAEQGTPFCEICEHARRAREES